MSDICNDMGEWHGYDLVNVVKGKGGRDAGVVWGMQGGLGLDLVH